MSSVWRDDGAGRWTLVLAGDWRPDNALRWPARPAALGRGGWVGFDTQALAGWDIGLAAQLWPLRAALLRDGVAVDESGLPGGLRDVLALAAPQAASAVGQALPARSDSAWRRALLTVTFFGEVLLALGRRLRRGVWPRTAEVLHQLDHTGPRSLPIVLLTCALIGLMLAYMGGAQLGRIGAQGYIANVVTVAMVRELAGLMTGVILAGRVGAAFAAQLASMQAGEEIDALRVLGIDPIEHLVLPRLAALLLSAPVLIACGALAGMATGGLATVAVYPVTTAEYLHQTHAAITFTDLWIGLFKGLLYAALVALAGCREGLYAGRSAQAVGEATTAAVVKALVWIICAACATTVVFTYLGY